MSEPRRGLSAVVHVGFSGSRRLFDAGASPPGAEARQALEDRLAEHLSKLPAALELPPSRFLCGVSQIAIGGDVLFSKACERLGILHRVFLPQHLDGYLDAVGSDGAPDFSREEREEVIGLLECEHVAEVRVVSDAHDRTSRFHDVNFEVVRVSDVIVCLFAAGAEPRAGGTHEVLELAERAGKPALVLRVTTKNGTPTLESEWQRRTSFTQPVLPQELAAVSVTPAGARETVSEYCEALTDFSSELAQRQSKFFKYAAVTVIGTHVLATCCAVIALRAHDPEAAFVTCLLVAEVLLLLVGLAAHLCLHSTSAVREWAIARLAAEIANSVLAMSRIHARLEHLLALPLPDSLRPLMRTIDVLHLHESRAARSESWETVRSDYLRKRLTDASERGQIPYYRAKLHESKRRLRIARRFFFASSGLAIAAAGIELACALLGNRIPHPPGPVTAVLGVLAVILPVAAVGAVSLAAALDLEGRSHTYGEMLESLERLATRLDSAASEREFRRLVFDVETRLLGETANWASRRAFTGVS